MQIIMGLAGIACLIGIAFLLSENRRAINLRTVAGAFVIQAALGALVLYVPFGQSMLAGISRAVENVIGHAYDGIRFLFGGLVQSEQLGFIFAVNVLPVIIFFAALIAVLYYLGIMPWIIKIIGGGLERALGTSRAESLSATANIFVGQTEAPLVVRPFIHRMTQSELFAVMTVGLASVAGSVLAGYAGLGVDLKFLIAASFMAAPGGLLMAKIIKPETEALHEDIAEVTADLREEKPVNVIHAAALGAASGTWLVINIGAMLLAFIGLIALLNGMLGGIGDWFNLPELTLQKMLGYVFAPVAFLIGVPWEEALVAGSFIGQKIILNEFVAFIEFAQVKDTLSEHTQAIVTFALCGFANLSSIAIQLGGVGSMAPNRREDIARMGMKAVAGGTLANLMSATLAGLFLAL